ncbi:MAG TPA: hypothetical protein VGD14_00360 [bacterium]
MPNVSVQLPMIEADQSIEVTVTINGQQKRFNYRIEIFPWSECREVVNKADCLRRVIENYDQHWQLIQIGEATENDVTLMFKQVAN